MTESSEEKAIKLKRNVLLAESDSRQENDNSLTDDEKETVLKHYISKYLDDGMVSK